MDMITELVDDMTVASAYSLLLPEGPKGRDQNSKELTVGLARESSDIFLDRSVGASLSNSDKPVVQFNL